MDKKVSSESVFKDIRRRTRKKYSSEEKIRIVIDGLRDEDSISCLCHRAGIPTNLYYRWSKDFLEVGKKRLAGDTTLEASSPEVLDLKKENGHLKQLVAEIALKNRVPKKKSEWVGLRGHRFMRYSSSEKDEAVNNTGLNRIQVKHRPRLLSDNSPCYISEELKSIWKNRA